MDFLLPSEPVEIGDFLLVLAGSFSEAIERELKIDVAAEGFWTRFVHWLSNTKVEIAGFDAKAGGLNFKTSLQRSPLISLASAGETLDAARRIAG